MANNTEEIKYCNWTFQECLKDQHKWLVLRDCTDETEMTLTRGDSRCWKEYQLSLQSRYQGELPLGKCPNCLKYINGVNPYDDGETWRK